MDFSLATYTQEQQRFRREVRAWLEANVPEEMKVPIDSDEFTEEQYRFWREKHKEMAARGWLFPTYPKEYGGGGLTADQEVVLEEEFQRFRVKRTFTADFILPSLLVWGTEEQKQRFLAPLLKGETIAWQKFTEPKSGSDLASYQSRAVRDGDDWVLSGSNVFCSGMGANAPDWLYGPMLTDPDAPRHRNLGFFMIPYPSPGLEIRKLNLLNGKDQHFVYLDNVRVPGDHLIGGDHQGWQVANTGLEKEHGGNGQAVPRDEVVENLLVYLREKRQKGQTPGGDPVLQQTAVDAYLGARVDALFKMRTYSMYMNRLEMSWEGPAQFYWQRFYGFRNAGRIRDVMGMYALAGTKEPRAPQGGVQEVHQRTSFSHQHAAGSFNITKVVLARRIGISRTKERAAPTPMTASKGGTG